MKKYKIKISFEREFEGENGEEAFIKFIDGYINCPQTTPMTFIIDNLKQEEI